MVLWSKVKAQFYWDARLPAVYINEEGFDFFFARECVRDISISTGVTGYQVSLKYFPNIFVYFRR